MLSSEKNALAGIALPQAFGVGFYYTPSAEKGRFSGCFSHIFSVLCVVGPRVGNGKQYRNMIFDCRACSKSLARPPYSSLLKHGLFPYLIRNIPVRFRLWHTKWCQVTGQGPIAVCNATWIVPSCVYKANVSYTCSKSGISPKKEFFLTPSSAVSGKMGAGSTAHSFWCFYST